MIWGMLLHKVLLSRQLYLAYTTLQSVHIVLLSQLQVPYWVQQSLLAGQQVQRLH